MIFFGRRDFLKLFGAAGAAAGLTSLPNFSWTAHAATKGGTLTIGASQNFSSLDPFKTIGRIDYNIVVNVLETLVTYGTDNIPAPKLAESWERVDQLTWRFKLREDAVNHDGTPFNAAAALYSFDRIREGNFKGQFARISAITATGDYGLEIKTSENFPTLLVELSQPYASMVSPEAFKQAGEAFGKKPIGSGPFKVETFDPTYEVVLVRNESWWGKDDAGTALPYLDKLVWRIMPDKETSTLALQNGEIDFLYELPPAMVPLLRNDPNITLSIAPTLGWEYLFFDCSKPPFDNVHARRAVQLAIDRQAIVDAVSFGTSTPCLGPITPASWAYKQGNAGEAVKIGPRADVAAAKAALAEGGLSGGFSFTMIHPSFPEFSAMAQAVQAQLAEIGVTVTLESKEISAVLDNLFSSNFVSLLINWGGRIDEALVFNSFFKTGGGNNFGKYGDPEVDKLIDAAAAAPTIPERAALYQQAERRLIDASPHAWISIPSELRAMRKNVEGFVNYGDVRARLWTVSKS